MRFIEGWFPFTSMLIISDMHLVTNASRCTLLHSLSASLAHTKSQTLTYMHTHHPIPMPLHHHHPSTQLSFNPEYFPDAIPTLAKAAASQTPAAAEEDQSAMALDLPSEDRPPPVGRCSPTPSASGQDRSE